MLVMVRSSRIPISSLVRWMLVFGLLSTAALSAQSADPAKERLVDAQLLLLLTQDTTVGYHDYPLDCTGTVLAAYEIAGVSLIEPFRAVGGGGVTRLYTIAEERGVFFRSGTPEPGDVLFWDNTYDSNGDGRFNDPLTHTGIVLTVEDDGTIEYLHHNYRRGIVVERMNLSRPDVYRDTDGTEVNSPMRMASHRYMNPDAWLASHLFRGYARLYTTTK